MLLYNVAWSQTDVECLLMEENSIFAWAPTVYLLKFSDADQKRDTDRDITSMFNRWHIWQISKLRKKLYMLGWKEVSNILCNMWVGIIMLKDSSSDDLKEGNNFGQSTSETHLWLSRLLTICSSWNWPWYEIAPQIITSSVLQLWHLIMHSGR